MYDEFCKRTVNFINQCLNSDCELVNQLVHHGIYFERARSPVGRNALICCKKYHVSDIQRVNSNTVHKWFNSTITDELLSNVLVLLELIFLLEMVLSRRQQLELPLFIHDKMSFRLFR